MLIGKKKNIIQRAKASELDSDMTKILELSNCKFNNYD